MTLALNIRNLKKIYPNNLVALKGISFQVHAGDFFALLGPNGAGKSTIIGILATLILKTTGTIEIFGYNLDHACTEAKLRIGFVPQEFNFSIFEKPFDILTNQAGYYGIPRKQARARAKKYLKQLGLWDKRNDIAHNLSGGMKRRLFIARALLHHPDLLILDEPTAGLDLETRHSMWQFLKEMNAAGTTIILTTHYLEEAEQLCNRIAIIDRGCIIQNDTMHNVLNQLKQETFILTLAEPVKNFSDDFFSAIPNFSHQLLEPNLLEISLPHPYTLNDIFEQLNQQDITITGIQNKTNRLETLFLKFVQTNTAQPQ